MALQKSKQQSPGMAGSRADALEGGRGSRAAHARSYRNIASAEPRQPPTGCHAAPQKPATAYGILSAATLRLSRDDKAPNSTDRIRSVSADFTMDGSR